MKMRKFTAAVFAVVAISPLWGGVAQALTSGTWKPASDWNGLSPSSFKLQCQSAGGTHKFEGGLWSCSRDGGTVYCDQGEGTKSTNCRRYTPPPKPTTYDGADGGPAQVPDQGPVYLP